MRISQSIEHFILFENDYLVNRVLLDFAQDGEYVEPLIPPALRNPWRRQVQYLFDLRRILSMSYSTSTISIADIMLDNEVYPRGSIDHKRIELFAENMRDGFEFEYRLLGIAYLLDKGQYGKSLDLFNQYYQQLKSRENLVKLPRFHSPKEELEFYLNLQNPKTGAFMDDAYPMCVCHGPTENVLKHIENLHPTPGDRNTAQAQISFNVSGPDKYTGKTD